VEEMRSGLSLIIISFGSIVILVSLFGMIYCHEFSISESLFIIGGVIAAFGMLSSQKLPKPKINTGQINKNIQSLNDLLWGKEKTPTNPIIKCHLCNIEMQSDGQLLIPIPGTNAVRVYKRFICPVCGYRRYD
jgi:hypothetical protein